MGHLKVQGGHRQSLNPGEQSWRDLWSAEPLDPDGARWVTLKLGGTSRLQVDDRVPHRLPVLDRDGRLARVSHEPELADVVNSHACEATVTYDQLERTVMTVSSGTGLSCPGDLGNQGESPQIGTR
jgi:hypothetical protein